MGPEFKKPAPAMDLKLFIKAAKLYPEVAQEILNSMSYDLGEGPSALSMLKDDVADDPKFHGITTDELNSFIFLTTPKHEKTRD